MYKGDTISLWIAIALVGLLSWNCQFPYEEIASDAITVVSIADAIYIAAATLLIGSKTAGAMKHTDPQIPTKTKMGVFVSYLRSAIIIGSLSIMGSIISKAYFTDNNFCIQHELLHRVVSAFSFAMFVATLLFMLIIFKFITVTLVNESHNN